VTSIVLLSIQIALLVIRCKHSISVTSASIPAAALEVISVSALIILLCLEYRRSIRPSTIVSLYLLSSSVANAIELRTLLLHHLILLAQLLGAAVLCKVILLCLESWPRKFPISLKRCIHQKNSLAYSLVLFFGGSTLFFAWEVEKSLPPRISIL
jgi:hypothetical protein